MSNSSNVHTPDYATVKELRMLLRNMARDYKRQGQFADWLGVTPGYLSLLLSKSPDRQYQTLDDRVLKAIGYEKKVYYRKRDAA